jgi:hypothetical protein
MWLISSTKSNMNFTINQQGVLLTRLAGITVFFYKRKEMQDAAI